MFRIGQFVMLIMPGELTTMSGRRMRFVHLNSLSSSAPSSDGASCRNAIRTQLIANGIVGDDAYVVIAGPANTYAHYVATQEEYGVQRYEGASTIFGQCKRPCAPFILHY